MINQYINSRNPFYEQCFSLYFSKKALGHILFIYPSVQKCVYHIFKSLFLGDIRKFLRQIFNWTVSENMHMYTADGSFKIIKLLFLSKIMFRDQFVDWFWLKKLIIFSHSQRKQWKTSFFPKLLLKNEAEWTPSLGLHIVAFGYSSAFFQMSHQNMVKTYWNT